MNRRLILSILLLLTVLGACAFLARGAFAQGVPSACQAHRGIVQRHMNVTFGARAPIAAFGGLIWQESSCNARALNRADGGAGLVQLTGKANIEWIAQGLGMSNLDPFDTAQAVRAGVWLLKFNFDRVRGRNLCHKLAAALVAYNAGLRWVRDAQRESPDPTRWWDVTERILTRQSEANFRASRSYPHKVLLRHQPRFAVWGRTACLNRGERA